MALPPVPDVYKLTVRQTSQGEPIINVFYYRDVAVVAPTPISVAQGFWDKVKVAWRGIPTTTQSYTFDNILCEQLFAPLGFATLSIPLAEQTPTRVLTSEPQPTWVAGLIRLTVATRSTRPGGKRISGLTENDTVGNNVNSAMITLLQALGNVFDDTFNSSPGASAMTPVIVGYPTPAPTNKPLRVQDVIGNSVDARVSHQVSRDPRRS